MKKLFGFNLFFYKIGIIFNIGFDIGYSIHFQKNVIYEVFIGLLYFNFVYFGCLYLFNILLDILGKNKNN